MEVEPGQRLHELRGSFMYMAPELWNLDYSKKADVWSIGLIAFMILTGKYPYSAAKSTVDLKELVLKTSIEDIIK